VWSTSENHLDWSSSRRLERNWASSLDIVREALTAVGALTALARVRDDAVAHKARTRQTFDPHIKFWDLDRKSHLPI
jgi:hypothetical protein